MNVFVADEQTEAVDVASLRDLATLVLERESCPPDTEVSVLLVGDEEMEGYHRKFLDRTGPTDVISLPIEELAPGRPPGSIPGGPPPMLGDVIVDPAHILRQARELERDFEDEMALMIVHGLLHLLGYDHEDEADAERMDERQSALLAEAGRKPR
jgi:probable rRNA maturation factor